MLDDELQRVEPFGVLRASRLTARGPAPAAGRRGQQFGIATVRLTFQSFENDRRRFAAMPGYGACGKIAPPSVVDRSLE
jgi:hypothetical protein